MGRNKPNRKTLARRIVTMSVVAMPIGLAGACASTATTGAASAPSSGATTSSSSAAASPSARPSSSPSQTPKPTPKPTTKPKPKPVNLTAGTGLTISNGTGYVRMNGTTVSFGGSVKDLAWAPDGAKAVFIDGNGDLAVANADGSGRFVLARNPGGETWSHPTWLRGTGGYIAPDARNDVYFASVKNGVSTLLYVSAGAPGGTPQFLRLGQAAGPSPSTIPQTGNSWPNSAGPHALSVYQYTTGAVSEVYIRDDYLRQQGGEMTAGAEPALSPDNGSIVFVRSVHGHEHLFRRDIRALHATDQDLTPDATVDYSAPVWSPDGKTIAFETPTGVDTINADGSGAPTVVSNSVGVPAYRS